MKIIWIWLSTTLFAVANTQMAYSTDEMEKFLIDAIQSNETYYEIDVAKDKPCQPFVNEKPDFTMPGRRISEAKCQEYIWELENWDKETEWGEICRIYLISQIKKGVIPEIFFVIQSPVIFGGRPATDGEFPHMKLLASLILTINHRFTVKENIVNKPAYPQRIPGIDTEGAVGWRSKDESPKWQFKCGSALISHRYTLTAAHCSKLSLKNTPDVLRREPEIVRFGVENIEDDKVNIHGDVVDIMIKRIIKHPNFAAPKKYYDIALIELETAVEFKRNIHPACLKHSFDESDIGKEVMLTGWGYTEEGKQPTQLQVANVDVIETKKCDDILTIFHNRNWGGFNEHQMCAGKLAGGVDTCQGDSGGPLQMKMPLTTEGKMYRILGVTSFGIKCGQKDRPGIYTRVSSFIDWIEEIVWGSNDTIPLQNILMNARYKYVNENASKVADGVEKIVPASAIIEESELVLSNTAKYLIPYTYKLLILIIFMSYSSNVVC